MDEKSFFQFRKYGSESKKRFLKRIVGIPEVIRIWNLLVLMELIRSNSGIGIGKTLKF